MRRQAVPRWIRDHPDAAVAAGLLSLGLVEAATQAPAAPSFEQAALTFGWTVPLLWRRSRPVVVLAIVTLMGPTLGLVNTQGGVNSFVLSAVLAAYTVGRELDAPATWWGPGLVLGVNWSLYTVLERDVFLSDFVFTALIYGGAWAVGYAIRQRDVRVGELTRTTDELRQEQAERARRAVADERVRIARELHDIVAHSISVITIQSQAVRRRLRPDQTREIDDLRAIETTARRAMGEMRRMLGVLRAEGEPVALAPQPGLGELSRLVNDARLGGMAVTLEVQGDAPALPPGLGLTAYRVVQEALTNVRKHADGAPTRVRLSFADGALDVRVEDDGATATTGLAADGHGLMGMRERVGLYGGTMTAGARETGGFTLQVRLPLPSPETAAP